MQGMQLTPPSSRCAGCGAVVAPPAWPFRCPEARPGDDIDHVLARVADPPGDLAAWSSCDEPGGTAGDENPFIRYRCRFSAWRLAVAGGLPDREYLTLVERLDAAIAKVDGRGFRFTGFAPAPALAGPLGIRAPGAVWVKDETGNVSESHKARHLAGIMLHLLVAERLGFLPSGRPRLAIASCGNAALAAAVLARAAGWPLDVFVPSSASSHVLARLRALGARITTCPRDPSVAGDPCYLAFRAALGLGALPFCCQGSDNGLTIEGGETLAWEMVEQAAGCHPPAAGSQPLFDAVFVQVGGGALASALVQGFRDALRRDAIERLPAFYAVQTLGAYPLKRAYDAVADRILEQMPEIVEAGHSPAADRLRADLIRGYPGLIQQEMRYARTHRRQFMRPWDREPRSIAHGILDDETYDWAVVVEAMLLTGGHPVLVREERLRAANSLARAATGVNVDHTGSAGLAGLMKALPLDPGLQTQRVAVIFSGGVRT